MVRGQAVVNTQTFNPAVKAYLASPERNIPKLLEYASQLGVGNKIRTYVEVLL